MNMTDYETRVFLLVQGRTTSHIACPTRLSTRAMPARSGLAPRADRGTCTACGGNDANVPCAYPGEGQPGCLRDLRLSEDGGLNAFQD